MVLNNKGQSTIEYIMLFLVVMTLTMTVFKSQAFQDFFGENSTFFEAIIKKIEYSYRYGTEFNATGYTMPLPPTSTGNPNFFDGNNSRFFVPITKYTQD